MTLPTHLAQVDREHFKIVDRVPDGFYWRSSPDLAWARKTEIDGEICWWMLQKMLDAWGTFNHKSKPWTASQEGLTLQNFISNTHSTQMRAEKVAKGYTAWQSVLAVDREQER